MATYPPGPAGSDAGAPAPETPLPATTEVADIQRTWLTEDWLATIVGLSLVLLLIFGILPTGVLS